MRKTEKDRKTENRKKTDSETKTESERKKVREVRNWDKVETLDGPSTHDPPHCCGERASGELWLPPLCRTAVSLGPGAHVAADGAGASILSPRR